jgi:hypothetical protein
MNRNKKHINGKSPFAFSKGPFVTKTRVISLWIIVICAVCFQIALSVSTASLGDALGVHTNEKERLIKENNLLEASISDKSSLFKVSLDSSAQGYSSAHTTIFLEPEDSVASIR